VHVTCAARTDVGLIRSGNEDNYLMIPDRGIFVVADGMGGHAAGEIASEMAVQLISRDLGSFKGLSVEEAGSRMTQAIKAANAAIFERTLSEHDKRGMGTTATVMVLHAGTRYLIGQVGDSRAYLLRDGRFHQLTKDHSYVQEQVDAGYLTPEQARTHPYANVITRCVGASGDVMPDIFAGTVRAGDTFLLASDGLTGMVEDDGLAAILQSQGTPERWVDKLVAEANRRGGLDNITCIVVQVDSVDAPPSEMTTTGEAQAAQRPKRPSGEQTVQS
jgi:protein phosphatase